MQRYFFSVFLSHVDIHDQVGTRLANLGEVRFHMTVVALAVMEGMKITEGSGEMEVLDGVGQIIMTMNFGVIADRIADDR